ncbi:hypothetical protein DH09_17880 [Bacillaceae bacterium JMAK1]|nr:hypothetical protein DH09_17880 [Bacillaceae bacterium JMAK1]
MLKTESLDEPLIRVMMPSDITDVAVLAAEGFGNEQIVFKEKHYEKHLEYFPNGQFVAELQGQIVGSCSSLIVDMSDYAKQHTISEITGNGYFHNHNYDGTHLYGADVVVHPSYRGRKIGHLLYEQRRQLCRELGLKGIMFGGRIPHYHRYAKELSAEEYCQQVINGDLQDPVMSFQLGQGFQFQRVLEGYLPKDHESLEYATLMEWKNTGT